MSSSKSIGIGNAIASGIGGFTSGYIQGRRLKMSEDQERRREERDNKRWERQEKLDSLQMDEMTRSKRARRVPDAYRFASMGDERSALEILNEGAEEGTGITRAIVSDDGSFLLKDASGKTTPILFKNLAPYMPELSKAGAGVADYDSETAIEELGTYFNIDPISRDNPSGITPSKRKAIIQAIGMGKPASEIGSALRLTPRVTEADVETARANLEEKKAALAQIRRKATGGFMGIGRKISEAEQATIDEAQKEYDAAARDLAYSEKIAGAKLSEVVPGRKGNQGGIGSGARPRPEAEGEPGLQPAADPNQPQAAAITPGNGQGVRVESEAMKAYDDNGDGVINENDKAYVVARKVVDKLDTGDESVKALLEKRYGLHRIAEFRAIVDAYEKMKRSDAEARMGIGRSR
jgi:hypothetical protein